VVVSILGHGPDGNVAHRLQALGRAGEPLVGLGVVADCHVGIGPVRVGGPGVGEVGTGEALHVRAPHRGPARFARVADRHAATIDTPAYGGSMAPPALRLLATAAGISSRQEAAARSWRDKRICPPGLPWAEKTNTHTGPSSATSPMVMVLRLDRQSVV